jgi:L-alanine-DL-glutamate epimerase-like enolase superfamily enzyme
MEIRDIESIRVEHQTATERDEKGHSHPGEPQTTTSTITRVAVDGGPDGYCVGGHPAANDTAASYLAGRDPLAREAIWERLHRTQRLHKGTLAPARIGAIDAALWDVAGKHAGLPVANLLGGGRDSVPAYGSTMVGDDDPEGLGTPEAYAEFAVDLVDQGYEAIKLHGWMPPYSADPDRDAAACRAVREAVGPDVDLMLDAHHFYSRREAKRLGRALADLEYRWFEEPMDEYSMSAYEWLSDELDVAVVGPETVEGSMKSRAEWVKRGISDICRVGVFDVGGITPALKTVHTCESFDVACEVHGGGAANLHLVAATLGTEFYERGLLHPHVEYGSAPWLASPVDPLSEDGTVPVPDRPGLGYDFDWDWVEANRV